MLENKDKMEVKDADLIPKKQIGNGVIWFPFIIYSSIKYEENDNHILEKRNQNFYSVSIIRFLFIRSYHDAAYSCLRILMHKAGNGIDDPLHFFCLKQYLVRADDFY